MVSRDLEEVKNSILESFGSESQIISIDGWNGSGKTYLANTFQDNDQIEIIHIDSYLNKNGGLYLEEIRYDDLKEKISRLLDSNSKILIEGACILEILENIEYESQITVYIKEQGSGNEWYYEKYLDEEKTLDEIFKEEDEKDNDPIPIEGHISIPSAANNDSSKEHKGLFYDVVRYHRNYSPHNNYDILLERV